MSFHTPGCIAPIAAVLLSATSAPALAQKSEDVPSRSEVALFDNLGNHHYEITTSSPEAQAYFDQGLRLYYAFNHPESIRSFQEAQRRDPECAMCFWGEALARGPNINMPMDSTAGVAAFEAIERAEELSRHTGVRERDLIDALARRYEPVPPDDRLHLDSAYSTAMAELVERYPNDQEIAVLYGESVMDLQPWDYWTEAGTLRPGMPAALGQFGRIQEVNPNHPGACHFFIHAVEKEQPERAVPCAERLADLMPGAGHLVHMPGHIYIRVGRYLDAVEANRHAVHADETYIQDRNPGLGMYTVGYYPHNYDFMAFAASMIGRADDAIWAAEQVAALIPQNMIGQHGMAFLEHWKMRPLQFEVRFGRWDDVLARPAPAEELPHARALWHYSRGRALAATGNLDGARLQLARLQELAEDPALENVRMEFNRSSDLLAVAVHVLAGWVAAEDGNYDDAIDELVAAARFEDALLYGEPPEWSVPVRQELGVVLLRAERWEDAERVFREDLDRFADNGWSLAGLASALEGQRRHDEALDVRHRFEEVWRTADVAIDTLF